MTTFLTAAGGVDGVFFTQIAVMVLLFGFMYFFMIRPQKKKDKQVAEMRNAIEVGDEIITIGGIIGIVVSVKDDTIVLETGSDRSKVRMARWAIQTNLTPKAKPEPVKAKNETKEKKETKTKGE